MMEQISLPIKSSFVGQPPIVPATGSWHSSEDGEYGGFWTWTISIAGSAVSGIKFDSEQEGVIDYINPKSDILQDIFSDGLIASNDYIMRIGDDIVNSSRQARKILRKYRTQDDIVEIEIKRFIGRDGSYRSVEAIAANPNIRTEPEQTEVKISPQAQKRPRKEKDQVDITETIQIAPIKRKSGRQCRPSPQAAVDDLVCISDSEPDDGMGIDSAVTITPGVTRNLNQNKIILEGSKRQKRLDSVQARVPMSVVSTSYGAGMMGKTTKTRKGVTVLEVHLSFGVAYFQPECVFDYKDTNKPPLLSYPNSTAKGAVNIYDMDLLRLSKGIFLNDNLIDFGLKYLFDKGILKLPDLDHRERLAKQKAWEGRKDGFHCFSQFFFSKLLESMKSGGFFSKSSKSVQGQKDEWERLRRWSGGSDIMAKEVLIIPINRDLHWSVAIVYNPGALQYASSELQNLKKLEKSAEELSKNKIEDDEQSRDEKTAELPGEDKNIEQSSDEKIAEPPGEHKNIEQSSDEKTAELPGEDKSIEQSGDEKTAELPDEDKSIEQSSDEKTAELPGEDKQRAKRHREVIAESAQKKTKEEEKIQWSIEAAERRPCIILLDSAKYHNSQSIFKHIRKYLQFVWDETRSEQFGQRVFDSRTIPAFSPKVSQQTNDCDCGIYLLHFVEQIMEFHPIVDETFIEQKAPLWTHPPSSQINDKRQVTKKQKKELNHDMKKGDSAKKRKLQVPDNSEDSLTNKILKKRSEMRSLLLSLAHERHVNNSNCISVD